MLPMLGLASLSLALVAYGGMEDSASAVYTPAMGNVVTAGVLTDMSLGVTIDNSSDLILEISPDANGKFAQGDINVTVNTSNVFGYKLNMYAYEPNSTDATTSLTNISTTLAGGTHPTINSITNNYSAETFASSTETKNKWGYKINSEENFKPVSAITEINGAGTYGSTQEKVTFGAKVANDIPNGLYQVTLNFVAIATEPTDANVSSSFETAFAYAGVTPYGNTGYYAMQDMTDVICGYVYTPKTSGAIADPEDYANTKSIQLVDKRDGELYWVSKLADGNCWMTQNLDFDITGPLTSDTTDLKTTTGLLYAGANVEGQDYNDKGYNFNEATGIITWNPAHTTYKVTKESTTGDGDKGGEIGTGDGKWNNGNYTPYSVDAGKWYQNGTFFPSSDCNDVNWSEGCNFLNNTKTTAQNGEDLNHYFATTPFEGNGEHGAVGNWYNWSAAVASNDTSSAEYGAGKSPNGDQPVNTICPKGWTLPVTAETTTSGSEVKGTWGYLNKIYNNSLMNNAEGLTNLPLYLVRGGIIYTISGLSTLYDAGRSGYYWSGTASTADYGYSLGFRSGVVNTAGSYARGFGISVRCVAQ